MTGRQTRLGGTIAGLLFLLLLPPFFVQAQQPQDAKKIQEDVKAWALKTAQFKEWLDELHGDQYNFWTRLDGTRRPHKLYVSEGFTKAPFKDQEQFVEIFSHYLAGHPDKYMLIDLYDSQTGEVIGEYGFGGFKLFSTSAGSQAETAAAPQPAH
jgi:hypothetical protein